MNAPSVASDAPIASFVPELDTIAAAAMADWKVPGAAVAVVQNGKVILLKAYGQRDVEANLPVTTGTQFLICSITKSFTATGMALLHNERRLDWTKPVRDYIPEFRLHDPVATERITVGDLLCHHSGLPRHDWVWMPGDISRDEMLTAMRHLEPSRDIRAAWQYNNLGYNIAGAVIERVTGTSYESFMRKRLTDKLGMSVSFTVDALAAAEDAAVPYAINENTVLRTKYWPITSTAAGAINTSITDIASWLQLHLDKGKFDGEQLLPATSIAELHAPRAYVAAPEFAEFGPWHYGRGFVSTTYRGDRLASHSGGWIGWGTLMTVLPENGIGVAVFTNRSSNPVTDILTRYIIDRLRGRETVNWLERYGERRRKALAQIQTDKDARQKARHQNTRPSRVLADYAGDYEHPAYRVMSVTEEGGALRWAWRGMSGVLEHRHYETFELPEVPDRLFPDRLPITFSTDRDGNLVSLSAPLEPMVKDIVFVRRAVGDCTDPAFRQACIGVFTTGATTHQVTRDADGNLMLKPDDQPAYRLAPHQGRKFRIVELDGYVVEFLGEDARVDEIIFHQPNGTFQAKRVEAATPQEPPVSSP
ncbi:serine hydrolase [Bradyrhizobium sp. LHD-71]|uniref:serine hydrolase n=1 Tax=Bradyrhizobium sp. LHD-71 TaxID=3072141 RepID=UPI00280DB01F|nr:serine hydrolase [Bradyrhizobium sp. LHD-71]MDQ8729430.1 serine hydrolase [Bradyrhizobium sp. LHD-71]